jgi:hypothetical protein
VPISVESAILLKSGAFGIVAPVPIGVESAILLKSEAFGIVAPVPIGVGALPLSPVGRIGQSADSTRLGRGQQIGREKFLPSPAPMISTTAILLKSGADRGCLCR